MVEEVFITAKHYERAAVPLQRLWRIRALSRAFRKHWRRQFAVLTIQRFVRGCIGRAYAKLKKKMLPIAAVCIQRCYRRYRSNIIVAIWHKAVYRMTRKVLPWIKLFLKKCFESWLRKRFLFPFLSFLILIVFFLCVELYCMHYIV
jgi:hypothetical protein